MPTFEKIKWMPPTITLINTLVDLGYDITYITIYPDEYYQILTSITLRIFLCVRKLSACWIIAETKNIIFYRL